MVILYTIDNEELELNCWHRTSLSSSVIEEKKLLLTVIVFTAFSPFLSAMWNSHLLLV